MKQVILGMALLLVCSGCANGKSVRTETHKVMEHAGIDWFNF